MEKIRLKLSAYDHRVVDRSVSSIIAIARKKENISNLSNNSNFQKHKYTIP